MAEPSSSSSSPHSSQPSAPYDQQPPLKRVKDDAASAASTPSSSSSSKPARRPHLKPAEESLPIEEQEKIIRRRARDAERKRRDRELARRAAAAAAAGMTLASDGVETSSSKPSPSSSTPSTPVTDHFHGTGAARSHPRPTPPSASRPTDDARALETAAAVAAAMSAAAAERKAKAAADKKAAAERRAAAAAEKLAAERAALLAAEEEAEEEAFEEDEEDQKLYCICRTLYDEERMMVACDHDRCGGEWYHTDCMGMDDDMVALVDVFICPRCEPFTTERTSMKPPCLRQDCKNAARPPLSRYCSDRCGILVAAARIGKTKYAKASSGGAKKLLTKQVKAATRKEGMVVWGDAAADQEGVQRWFEKLCVADNRNEEEEQQEDGAPRPHAAMEMQLSAGSSREEERLVDLRRHLANLASHRQEVSTALDLAESRVKLLQLVDDRLGVLPPVVLEEAAAPTSKKSKSKAGSKKDDGGAALKTQPRCGYDERLSWDDERFSAWMASEEGREMLSGSKELDGRLVDADGVDVVLANGDATEAAAGSSSAAAMAKICGVAKRKCKRHAEWNVVRTDDFEVEKDSQTSALSTLSEEISRTNAQIADLEAMLQAKRTPQDARSNGDGMAVN